MIAAAATAFSAITSVVASAAATISAIGSTTIIGSITVSQAINALSMVASVVAATRKPKLDPTGGSPTDFKSDPNAHVPIVLGRTGVSGNIVMAATHGPNNRYLSYVTVLSGAASQGIDAIESFKAGQDAVLFTSDSNEGATGKYRHRMWQKTALGIAGAAALIMTAVGTKDTPADHGPTLNGSGYWGANHKLSGKAHTLWTLSYDTKIYSSGVPKPQWTIRGIKVYDRRKDGSVGGVGLHRINNPDTWGYSTNPYVHATQYLIGYYEKSEAGVWIKVGGVGLPESAIDWSAYVDGMNIADANGWEVGGQIHTGMPKWPTLTAILQSGGGLPLSRGAIVSCMVSAPKVSVATIQEADCLVQAAVDAGSLRRDRINTVVPRYRSEAHNWEMVPGSAISNATYVTEDGEERPRELPLELVQKATQAGQLATYHMVEGREGISATISVGPQFMDVRAGSAVTVNIATAGLNNQKMVVQKRKFDPTTFAITLTLKTETDAKHAYALGQTTVAPPTSTLTLADPTVIPIPGAAVYTVTSATIAGNGTVLPVIRVQQTGDPDWPMAGSIIVDYKPTGTTKWISKEQPISDTYIEISGLTPGTTYNVRLRYRAEWGAEDTATGRAVADVVTGIFCATTATEVPITGVPSAVTRPGANLVYDGGGRLNFDRWSLFGVAARFRTAELGNYIYGTEPGASVFSPRFGVAFGQSITAQAMMVSVGGTGGTQLGLRWYNSSDVQVGTDATVNVVQNAGRAKYVVTGTVPATAIWARVFTYTSIASGQYWDVSRVKAEWGTVASVFTDDATDGARYSDGVVVDTLRPAEVGSTVGAVPGVNFRRTPGGTVIAMSEVDNVNVPVGANCIPNASFESGDFGAGWAAGWDGTAGTTITRGVNAIGYFGGRNVAWGQAAGTPANGTVFDVVGPPGYATGVVSLDWLERNALPVAQGDRVYVSALMAYHRAAFGALIVWFFDRTGANIAFGSGGEYSVGGGRLNGGADGAPANFDRVGGFGTAPANAAYAVVFIRLYCNGGSTPTLYFTDVMLSKVNAGQTAAPPFIGSGPDRIAGRFQNDLGRIISGRYSLPLNMQTNMGVTFSPTYPLSAGATPSTQIAVAATTITFPGGETVVTGATTITGLTQNTTYSVFYDLQTSSYIATTAGTSYRASVDRYISLGAQTTALSGGGYSPPPAPPSGGGGGFPGVVLP